MIPRTRAALRRLLIRTAPLALAPRVLAVHPGGRAPRRVIREQLSPWRAYLLLPHRIEPAGRVHRLARGHGELCLYGRQRDAQGDRQGAPHECSIGLPGVRSHQPRTDSALRLAGQLSGIARGAAEPSLGAAEVRGRPGGSLLPGSDRGDGPMELGVGRNACFTPSPRPGRM